MKNLLPAIMFLLCAQSYAQVSHAYDPNAGGDGDQRSKIPALSNLTEKPDSITGNIFYYDPKTSVDNIHGDGIFASIYKNKDGYVLRFIAYHVAPGVVVSGGFGGSTATPEDITGVYIKTSDSLFAFQDLSQIQSNGSSFPHIVITGDKAYNVLNNIVKTDYAKLHFESLPQLPDHELSNREIKEIVNVLKSWLAVNNIK